VNFEINCKIQYFRLEEKKKVEDLILEHEASKLEITRAL
jgi:hypothetical protein